MKKICAGAYQAYFRGTNHQIRESQEKVLSTFKSPKEGIDYIENNWDALKVFN